MNKLIKDSITIVVFFTGSIFLFSCQPKKETSSASGEYYTCPMHPSVISDVPGVCPVCNMNLVKKQVSTDAHSNMVHLSEREQLLANIKTDTARIVDIIPETVLLGTAAIDETRISTLSAKTGGRIEKLLARNPGELIQKGDPLYQLYSEELLAVQEDYLKLLRQKSDSSILSSELYNQLMQASEKKLMLWGMTNKQLEELAATKKPLTYVNYYSEETGYLTDLMVKEGEYVMEGNPLFKIADLSEIWVETQVYTNETSLLLSPSKVSVAFENLPNRQFKAEIDFFNPFIEKGSKINLVRFRIKNLEHIIKPGMMAYVSVGNKTKPALAVPKSAVLLEKMKVAWIEVEPGMYERRMVKTGVESKHIVEITEGVREGEKVVVSGAYLLNSEYILKQGASQKHVH